MVGVAEEDHVNHGRTISKTGQASWCHYCCASQMTVVDIVRQGLLMDQTHFPRDKLKYNANLLNAFTWTSNDSMQHMIWSLLLLNVIIKCIWYRAMCRPCRIVGVINRDKLSSFNWPKTSLHKLLFNFTVCVVQNYNGALGPSQVDRHQSLLPILTRIHYWKTSTTANLL